MTSNIKQNNTFLATNNGWSKIVAQLSDVPQKFWTLKKIFSRHYLERQIYL